MNFFDEDTRTIALLKDSKFKAKSDKNGKIDKRLVITTWIRITDKVKELLDSRLLPLIAAGESEAEADFALKGIDVDEEVLCNIKMYPVTAKEGFSDKSKPKVAIGTNDGNIAAVRLKKISIREKYAYLVIQFTCHYNKELWHWLPDLIGNEYILGMSPAEPVLPLEVKDEPETKEVVDKETGEVKQLKKGE